MAKSIYERMKDVESWIPQLDAAQTENAQDLLAMIAILAQKHNQLVQLIAYITHEPANKFGEVIVNIDEAIERPDKLAEP